MKNRAVETFRLSMFRWFCVQTWHIMRVYPFRLIWNQEGNGNPLQYSCLANPMDGGAWWAAVRAVAKSWTGLNDFTFIFHFHALEKEMATHSSVLAWRIPGTGEPGGLPSMGWHRVGHNWNDLAAAAAAIPMAGTSLQSLLLVSWTFIMTLNKLILAHTPCSLPGTIVTEIFGIILISTVFVEKTYPNLWN